MRHFTRQLLRWTALGIVVGILAGVSSAAFLTALDAATDARGYHSWLVWLLPAAGLGVGLLYRHLGGRAAEGNQLVLDEIHDSQVGVPRRMAPLVFTGTVVTHLVGGSAGREGAALQMSASLTDGVARAVRLRRDERQLLLVAALAGGFGAVFGVPIAGVVFGLEVEPHRPPAPRRRRWYRARSWALVTSIVAATCGDFVVRHLGVEHTPLPTLRGIDVSDLVLAKSALAGVVFGLTARTFIGLTHRLKSLIQRWVSWSPARPALGGLVLIGLTLAAGTRGYLGLSLPLLTASVVGGSVVAAAFAWKLLFSAITLGSGFPGGEVTPLFVIGATLGVSLGRLLDVPTPLLAAVGLVAVFAGAAKTPLACIVMGVELFGWLPLGPLVVACALSAATSGGHGLYARRPGSVERVAVVGSG